MNAALDSAFDDAEALLMQRFESVTLAELAADFASRFRDDEQKQRFPR